VPNLNETLNKHRPDVVRDASELVDAEVSAKGGVAGFAIKAAYKTVKAVKPGLIPDVIDGLLDQFIGRLEPFFAEWEKGGKSGSFGAFLSSRPGAAANALLGVTDDRAKVVANKTLKSAYQSLRPHGEKNVEAAIPGLGRLIDRFLAKP